MLSEEIIKKVRRIEISTRKIVNDAMTGNYKSHFKGHGVQFSEHRVYVPGDDIRRIDWKVSARSKDIVIKQYEEERQLTVLLIVDVSGSTHFGTGEKIKSEAVAEVASMVAFAASRTGDRVGVIFFAGEVEYVIPPKKSRNHISRIIGEILSFKSKTNGTNLSAALDAAGRVLNQTGVVFILSDFLDENYDNSLKKLSRKHDVVAFQLADPGEMQIPNLGYIRFFESEKNKEVWVDSRSYAFKTWLEQKLQKEINRSESLFKKSKVEKIKVSTAEDYTEAVVRFFESRTRRRGR